MNIRLQLFLISCISFCSIHAQNTFQKSIGSNDQTMINSVKSTSDGGFILAGTTNIIAKDPSLLAGAGKDVLIIKTNANGDTLWSKAYGTERDDEAYDVIPLPDGGYVVAGNTIDSASGNTDILGIRLNASGNIVWFGQFGGNRDEMAFSVCLSEDGGYIFSGMTETFTSGYNAAYVVKTNANGVKQWSRSFEDDDDEDWLLSSIKTKDGGNVFAGYTNSYGPGRCGMYLIKLKSSGETEWRRSYGGNNHRSEGYSIKETADGGFVIAGSILQTGIGNGRAKDVYVIRLKPDGDTLWTRTYGGSLDEEGRSVAISADGGYIISGYTKSFGSGLEDIYVLKLKANGDPLWIKTFGDKGTDEGYSLVETSDGGIVLAGKWDSGNGFLLKVDKDGNSGCLGNNTETFYSSVPTLKLDVNSPIDTPSTIQRSLVYSIEKGRGVANICSTDIGFEDDLREENIMVYPNPSQGIFNLVSDLRFNEINIVDLLGQTIFASKQPITGNYLFHIQNSGIYFLTATTGNKSITKKILVN